MTRKFGKIELHDSPLDGHKRYVIKIKVANDFRHWAHRDNFDTHPSRQAAREHAEMVGVTVVKRWADVTLTKEESVASGYYECSWFALCTNTATKLRSQPVLGDVPICDRCDDKVSRIGAS